MTPLYTLLDYEEAVIHKTHEVKYDFRWASTPMCQGDYGTAEDECCSAVKPILTQWGLVPSFTTSDLGEVGKRELYREQGTLY